MAQAPVVSVILPVRNGAGTLGSAIESIRRQTWMAWELLIIDDGSTDGSAAVAREAARADSRIRVLERPPAGIVEALNWGLGAASGEFLARMDADDVSHPERLAEQVGLLRARPELGVAGCLVEFGGDRSASGGYARYVDWTNSLQTVESIALSRFIECPMPHPSVMFRRNCVRMLGGYREGNFPEDYELWLRWIEGGVRMAKVPRPLLTWNDPPGRLSRCDLRYGAKAFFAMKGDYLLRELDRTVRGRSVWLWGAGRVTRRRAEILLRDGLPVAGFVDIDPNKQGLRPGARRVLAPEELPDPDACLVIGCVSSWGAREDTRRWLLGRGFVEGKDFWIAA